MDSTTITDTDTIILDFITSARANHVTVVKATKGPFRVRFGKGLDVELHSRARFFLRVGKRARPITETSARERLGLAVN